MSALPNPPRRTIDSLTTPTRELAAALHANGLDRAEAIRTAACAAARALLYAWNSGQDHVAITPHTTSATQRATQATEQAARLALAGAAQKYVQHLRAAATATDAPPPHTNSAGGADGVHASFVPPDAGACPTSLARLPGELYEHLLQTPLTAAPDERAALRAHRLSSGSFYTPASLVEHMCGLVELSPADTVFDPAMGCGYFLLGVLDKLAAVLPPSELASWAREHLRGADINPGAVEVARCCLQLRLSTPGAPFDAAPCVRAADTLLEPDNGTTYDCIIGNPPYDVLTNFARRPQSAAYAAALRASGRYLRSQQGQLNLYRCFIERGLQLLKPGGRLCYIVPATLAADKAAQNLRDDLLTHHQADYFEFLRENDPRFPGICQSTLIVRARRDAGAAARIRVLAAGEDGTLTQAELRHTDGRIPSAGLSVLRLQIWLREHCRRTLGEVVQARVGEVDQTVYRDCMRSAPTGTLLLRGSHLRPFAADLGTDDAHERYLDEALFREKTASKQAILQPLLQAPRVVQLGIRNLASRPRLIAALLPPGIYCGNSINVYLPRPGVSLALLAGVLSCRLYDTLFCAVSTNNNINLHEMLRMPFPDTISPSAAEAVERAYFACAAAAEARDDLRLPELAADLNRATEDLFQLPATYCALLDGTNKRERPHRPSNE